MKIAYNEFKSPLSVQLELTSECNHSCIHCYNHWRENGDFVRTVTREDLRSIISNLLENEVHDLVITGGEPLLYPELVFETVNLVDKKVRCSINSNISLMTDEIASRLKKWNVKLLVSFPSYDATTFNRIVNKRNAFYRVVEGIKIALRHKIPVSANMVVMRDNTDHVYKTGKHLFSIGIRSFSATKVHPAQNSSNFDSLRINPEEILSVFNSLLLLKKEFNINIDTLTPYPMCLFGDTDRYDELVVHRSCSAGKTGATIAPDGSVRPCSHSDDVYGNAIHENLNDIWLRMKKWRDGSLIPEHCISCNWLINCGAGCRTDSKFFHGRCDQPDPYMTTNAARTTRIKSGALPPLDLDQKLIVNPALKYREEKFGVVIYTEKLSRTITNDSSDLLKHLAQRHFSINDILAMYELDPENTKKFFSSLLKCEIVLRQN